MSERNGAEWYGRKWRERGWEREQRWKWTLFLCMQVSLGVCGESREREWRGGGAEPALGQIQFKANSQTTTSAEKPPDSTSYQGSDGEQSFGRESKKNFVWINLHSLFLSVLLCFCLLSGLDFFYFQIFGRLVYQTIHIIRYFMSAVGLGDMAKNVVMIKKFHIMLSWCQIIIFKVKV